MEGRRLLWTVPPIPVCAAVPSANCKHAQRATAQHAQQSSGLGCLERLLLPVEFVRQSVGSEGTCPRSLFLVASCYYCKALVTSSVALVPNSFLSSLRSASGGDEEPGAATVGAWTHLACVVGFLWT